MNKQQKSPVKCLYEINFYLILIYKFLLILYMSLLYSQISI